MSCLGYSKGSNDSVKALNALGRTSIKLNDTKNAITYYNLIISKFSAVTDENGLPYVYYALPQLLKITDPDNHEEIFPEIEFCLEKMETGSIPLNFNSEELFILVANWLKDNPFSNKERSSDISTLIESIKKQVQFTIKYGNELSELMRKGNSENHFTAGNDFKVVNSISGNNQEFFLINTNFENPAGFLIDRKKLFDTISKTDLQSGFEFDYKIEFPTVNNSNTTGDNLIYTSQLNPLFPGANYRNKT